MTMVKKGLTTAAAALAALATPAFAADTITDGSFESQGASVGSGFCYTLGNYAPACATGAWVGGGQTSGFQSEDNGAWPGAQTPAGGYYAFIQSGYGAPGSMSQQIELSGGEYVFGWLDAGRPNGAGNQAYNVLLDGVLIGSGLTTTNQGFTARSTGRVTAAAGTYTLTFQALDSGGDNAAFIDNVTLAAVPEPATWGMMILGFGMVGFGLRRRKAAVRTSVRFA